MKNYFKNIYNLTKYNLKTLLPKKSNKDKKTLKILGYFGIICLFIYFAALGYYLSKEAISTFSKLGIANYFIIILIVTTYIFTFLSSMSILMPNKNSDKSEEYIDTMPLTSRQRYIAKNITYVIYSYSLMSFATIIPLIYFGINQNMNVLYFLRTILAFILIPVVPVVVLVAFFSFLKIILDYITKGRSNKIYTVLTFAIVIYLYYIIYYKMQATGNVQMYLMELINSSKDNIFMFLPMKFTQFIVGENVFLNLLIILGISIGFFVVFTVLIGNMKNSFSKLKEKINFFDKQNEKNNENTKNIELKKEEKENKEVTKKENKKINNKELKPSIFKQKSQAHAYIKREFGVFTRNIELALNSMFIPVIVPFFMILVMIFMMSGEMKKSYDAKDEMYIVSSMDTKAIEEKIKNKEDLSVLDLEEEYRKSIKYSLMDKYSFEKQKKQEVNNKITQLEFTKNFLETKIKEENKKAKEIEIGKLQNILNGINSELDFLKAKKENNDDKITEKDYIVKLSFEGIEKEENIEDIRKKNFDKLKKAQEEGKIHKITEEEIKKQKEDESHKDFAKYEMPTEIIGMYKFHEEIFSSGSIIKYILKSIGNIRGKYDFKNLPNNTQYLIPIGVSTFIIFTFQMSIFMFSKDKNDINFLKTIPISFKKQLKYKKIPGIITITSTILFYFVIAEILLDIKMYTSIYFLLGLVISFFIIIFFNNIEIFLDLIKPNFNWTDSNTLAKGNGKNFLLNILKLLMIAVFIIGGYLLISKYKIFNFNTYIIISAAAIVALSVLSEIIVNKKGPKYFKKLGN